MKRNWNKPICITMMAQDLSAHIQAAAWSDNILCTDFVLR